MIACMILQAMGYAYHSRSC